MLDAPTAPKSTKLVLMTEARRLFARHGYEGVSMRDIAAAVGIRQSAIYNHFSGKQEMLVEVMVDHMQPVFDSLLVELDGVNGSAQQLETFARFHVRYHFDQPNEVFLAYMELRSLEEPGRSKVMALRNAYEAVLRDILEQGMQSGQFKITIPAVTARGLLAMLTAVTVWFREDGALSREEVTESYVQATMQSVGLIYCA